MTPEELQNEIAAFCKANYNEANVKKYSRYFKDGVFDSWGLTVELLHGKVDEIVGRKDVDFQLIRKTCLILVKGPKYEETSFAIAFYRKYSDGFSRQTFEDITHWFENGIRNWGHCDVISGDHMFTLLSRNIIGFRDLSPWLTAENKYQRRSVPVSLIKLLKTSPDFRQYFQFIEPLMNGQEREVNQGTGWFLREAWKLKRNITEEFLEKWKDISPRLIFQYACEKMSSDEKSRFRRAK
jgi:3-methyladenine DNA glycosylase AlkD